MSHLAGRTAVITGAAGGIGAATAHALAQRGCHLALADVDAGRLEALASRLRADGRRVSTHVVDIGTPEGNEALAREAADAHGAVHVVILNAGVTTHGPFADQPADDITWVVRTDLLGVMYGAAAFIPLLRAAGGAQLVMVSSMAAMTGVPLQSTYSAAKAGVRAFAAALRVELAGEIGVTAILPGTIATGFLTRARGRHRTLDTLAHAMPQVGLAPERVGAAICAAIERNEPERTVGVDAWLVDRITRAWPRLLPTLFGLAFPLLKRGDP